MRGVKAEGGWGTVCTEFCSIHRTSDDEPFPYAALWDDRHVRAMGLTAEAIHAHGALAGVEAVVAGRPDHGAGIGDHAAVERRHARPDLPEVVEFAVVAEWRLVVMRDVDGEIGDVVHHAEEHDVSAFSR